MNKIKIDEMLVDALIQIVETMPRDTDKEGKVYNGLKPQDVAGAFYAVLRQVKHVLADEKNENCSYEKPCNSCRVCVLREHSQIAQDSKKILWIPKTRSIQDGKKWKKVSYGRYYRPGEIAGGKSYDDFASKLLAGLK